MLAKANEGLVEKVEQLERQCRKQDVRLVELVSNQDSATRKWPGADAYSVEEESETQDKVIWPVIAYTDLSE